MAQLIGSVDPRGRPLVRVQGKSERLLVPIDTGFNGDLILTSDAARLLGVEPGLGETEIELADGRIAHAFETSALIDWFGEQRRIRVLVSDARSVTRDDEPSGLLGTGLLAPHRLAIDFDTRTAVIESRE